MQPTKLICLVCFSTVHWMPPGFFIYLNYFFMTYYNVLFDKRILMNVFNCKLLLINVFIIIMSVLTFLTIIIMNVLKLTNFFPVKPNPY